MFTPKRILTLSALSTIPFLAFTPTTDAALVSGVSSSCSSALAGFLLGNLGNCLSLTTLLPVLESSSSSIISSLDSYLTTICSSDPCSNSTITSALTTIESSCSSDITNGTEIVVLLYDIVKNYDVEYEVACLEYTGNSTRCLTSTLTSIQTAINESITLDYLADLLSGDNQTQLTQLEGLGGGVYCTDCVKAIYDVVIANNASAADSDIAKAVTSECGASFTNATYPTDVSDPLTSTSSAATGSATATSSTAASSGTMGVNVLMGGKGMMALGMAGVSMLVGAGAVLI